MSRPEKKIDWKRVDKLLESGCQGTEIAAYFAMHPNTFYDRVVAKFKMSFTDYSCEKTSKGEALLREAQYDKAIRKRDNTMLVWLGKQRLGQRENPSEVQFSLERTKALDAVMEQLVALQMSKSQKDLNNSESNNKSE